METGLYVHIPFCMQKCLYCDFPSYPLRHLAPQYLAAMEKEAALYRQEQIVCSSVFIGGGTPTSLEPEELERLLNILHRSFLFADDVEFTVEANPGTVSPEKMRILQQGGVNRLSFGVQAFQSELLKKLGRLHTQEDIYRSFDLARNSGFANINIDLMSGLPGQTMADWTESLQCAVELGPEHIAAYGLKVEEGTPFYQLQVQGRLHLPDEDLDAAMVELSAEVLTCAGYHHYEISNYAKPNRQSRHNLRYWHNESYIGIGSSAWSYWKGLRRGNVAKVMQYITCLADGVSPVSEQEVPALEERMFETMMLGLRLTTGVDRQLFIRCFAVDPALHYAVVIAKMTKLGLIEVNDQYIRLTKQGLLLGNEVFAEFL